MMKSSASRNSEEETAFKKKILEKYERREVHIIHPLEYVGLFCLHFSLGVVLAICFEC